MFYLEIGDRVMYRTLLKKYLAKYADRLIITVTSDEDFEGQPFYQEFQEDIITVKKVREWPGTIRSGDRASSYYFPYNMKVAEYLKRYNCFYRAVSNDTYTLMESLDGIEADLAFMNGKEEILYTITHERETRIISKALTQELRQNGYEVYSHR
ncbi:hypothetical protein ERX27_09230 [Macrococcus brunensis]|uniref:Uncharacterized protein n=1 Tax=Macrococcus brunensis TaxID=198483 RepID=A0A4R6BBH5_9STAP|nr:hypothetical protein [Macrococcus brunensis]TDL94283.1 hypothetical protein ERX27_09230 [Macrococcus brunensis]